jgi:hypothetical protein
MIPDWIAIALMVIAFPFVLWLFFRISSTAIFRSWFEIKQQHETQKKKEEV